MLQLYVWLKNFVEVDLRNEEGQTAVEYAMVIALVAIALVVALATFGTNVFSSFWTKVGNALNFST